MQIKVASHREFFLTKFTREGESSKQPYIPEKNSEAYEKRWTH